MKSLKSSGKPRNKPKLLIIRRVHGDSMLPTLKPGHIVIGSSYYSLLRLGDVVIVRHGGLEKVKRIHLISKDHLFLVGDNEDHSTDSRSFGWLHVSVVAAKVLWPRVRRRGRGRSATMSPR